MLKLTDLYSVDAFHPLDDDSVVDSDEDVDAAIYGASMAALNRIIADALEGVDLLDYYDDDDVMSVESVSALDDDDIAPKHDAKEFVVLLDDDDTSTESATAAPNQHAKDVMETDDDDDVTMESVAAAPKQDAKEVVVIIHEKTRKIVPSS